MNEITITTNKMTGADAAGWQIWGWEIPVYLFLGGLTAGILVVAALMVLRNKGKECPVATNKIILLAPIFLSIGMGALFLDLAHKLYVWRFYTALKPTSVLSWGSWILALVYPVNIALILATLKEGYPKIHGWIDEKIKGLGIDILEKSYVWLMDFSGKHIKLWAKMSIGVGIALGVYTGILLSSLGVRPIWNSSIIGPLFLVSGISSGVALVVALAKGEERRYFAKIDMALIAGEIFLLALFIIGHLTSGAEQQEAVRLLIDRSLLAPVFWIFVVTMGLALPVFLEWLELRGGEVPAFLPPALVLFGGLVLRFVFVKACCLWREMNIERLIT